MAYNLSTDSDKAWEGLIYYKLKGTFVSRYETYWGVVRRESSRGLQRIDLFRQQSAVQPTSDIFIPLHDVLHVLNREARARKFAFQILGTGCKYHLATESRGERERWVQGLDALLYGPPQPGIVYEHQVHVIPNSHSERLQLSGRYVIRITDSHIALFTSTGTLPTRFRYSLSNIARTRYTNFTNSGKKFSVLVLYCTSDDIDRSSSSQTDESASHGRCSSTAASIESVFVFQTQSASTMSRIIDHRTKEIASTQGHRKYTPPSKTLNSPSHISPPPNSLPTSSLYATSLNDGEPLLISDDCKPNPLPRPTRRSLPASATSRVAHEKLCANEWSHSSDSTEKTRSPEQRTTVSGLKVKARKTPVPLPRKKHSLNSVTIPTSLNLPDNLDQPSKSKPVPPPKPKSRALTAKSSFHESATSTDPSFSNVASSNTVPTISTADGECDESSGSYSDNLNGHPTYMNLDPLDEKEGKDNNGDSEEVTSGEVTNLGSHERYYNLLPANTDMGSESKSNGGLGSHETYYNLPPGNEKSGSPSSGGGTGTASHERYYNLSPTNEEKSEHTHMASHERYYNLPPANPIAGSSSNTTEPSTEAVQRPTLDMFLGRILQQPTNDIRETCNEGATQDSCSHLESGQTIGDSTLNSSSVCQSPEYYNVPPALGDRGEGEEGEVEAVDDMLSLGEKEDRSEWLKIANKQGENGDARVQNEVGDNVLDTPTYLKILPSSPCQPSMGDRREGLEKATMDEENVRCGDDGNAEVQNVEENLSDKPTYLKILPSSPSHYNNPTQASTQTSTASHTASSSIGGVNTAPSENTEQQSSVMSLRESCGSSESGSPLWGTRQPWSRQNSVVSPLSYEEIHNGDNFPFHSAVPPDPRKQQKAVGFHPIIRKQRGSRKGHRRPSNSDDIFQWPSGHRGGRQRSSKNIVASHLHWVALGDESESEDESDYEWAEIAEALSDTGSDYVYIKPKEFESLGLGLSGIPRSISWSGLNRVNAVAAGPVSKDMSLNLQQSHTINDRPPAPLPAGTPDSIAMVPNDAHPDTPLVAMRSSELFRRRGNLKRSYSLDNSCIYEELPDDYEYIDSDFDYDYAYPPNRSAATLFPRERGEYVDINQHSLPSSPIHSKTLHPYRHPLPPPRPLLSLPISDV